uniref:Uncharacterized protein n=1 Tax=Cacopsylla melanoneura TaxID=428564 RepID=A0A8D9ALF8_9HEMI
MEYLEDEYYPQKRRMRGKRDTIKQEDKLNEREINVPKKLNRQKRQSKADSNDIELLSLELKKKAEKYSRMPYDEVFAAILKDFEEFKEKTYAKAYRKAYRSNGWAAKTFEIPRNPREGLPQVFAILNTYQKQISRNTIS